MNNNQKRVVFLRDFLRYLLKLDATQSHDKLKFHIVDYLKRNGFRAFVEHNLGMIIRKDSKDNGHKGRLDFYAVRRNMEVVGEIDRSVPKKRSIEKCSKYPSALKVFILRGEKIKYSETERRTKDIKKICSDESQRGQSHLF